MFGSVPGVVHGGEVVARWWCFGEVPKAVLQDVQELSFPLTVFLGLHSSQKSREEDFLLWQRRNLSILQSALRCPRSTVSISSPSLHASQAMKPLRIFDVHC